MGRAWRDTQACKRVNKEFLTSLACARVCVRTALVVHVCVATHGGSSPTLQQRSPFPILMQQVLCCLRKFPEGGD